MLWGGGGGSREERVGDAGEKEEIKTGKEGGERNDEGEEEMMQREEVSAGTLIFWVNDGTQGT